MANGFSCACGVRYGDLLREMRRGYVAGSDRQGGNLGITDGERYLFPLCTRAWATGVPPHMLAIPPPILYRGSYQHG